MSSTTAASDLAAGVWLGHLAAAVVQGTWQAMAADHGDMLLQPAEKLAGNKKTPAAAQGAPVPGGKAAKGGNVVGRCGAMSDATLCLLLGRFAPS